MRINEIITESVLDETTEQDQILVNVADAATRRVIDIFSDRESNFLNAKVATGDIFLSRKDRLTWLSGLRLKDLYLPQVNDPEIVRMLQTIKVKILVQWVLTLNTIMDLSALNCTFLRSLLMLKKLVTCRLIKLEAYSFTKCNML
jgi:hypothetical protein